MKFEHPGYRIVMFAALLLILWYIKILIFVLFGSIMIGIIGYGASNYISKKFNIKYIYGVLVLFFLLISVIAILILLALPSFSTQYEELLNQLPVHINDAEDTISQSLGIELEIVQRLRSIDFYSVIADYLPNIFTIISGFSAMIVIGIYLIVDNKTYKEIVYKFYPKKKASPIIDRVYHDVQRWFLGQFISMTIVGIFVTVALFILDVPFALILGFLSGFLEFVPTLGPIIAFIPIFIVSISKGLTLALYVAILYLIVQFIESNILTPLVQQKLVLVPAAVQLTMQIIFGVLFGLIGVFFAVPFFVFARAIYRGVKNYN